MPAVEDGSGLCKAGFTDDDAPRGVEDGRGKFSTGFARLPAMKSNMPKVPRTMDGSVPHVPGITDGMNQNASDSTLELLRLNIAKFDAQEALNTRPQRDP